MRLTHFLIFIVLLSIFVPSTLAGKAISESLYELGPGENVTLALGEFSWYSVRAYEGSMISFSVEKLQNRLILDQIFPNGNVDVHISIDNGPYAIYHLQLANETFINLGDSKVPFMTLEPKVLHYDSDQTKRNVVLFFKVPLFQTEQEYKDLLAQNNQTQNVTAQPSTTKKDPYLIYAIVIILVLILLNILLPYVKTAWMHKKAKQKK